MSLLLSFVGIVFFHRICMYRLYPCKQILVAWASGIQGYLVHCKVAAFCSLQNYVCDE
jgi:hypothetical protein